MNGNDIDARCYGYEPASTQLKELRMVIEDLKGSLRKHRDIIQEIREAHQITKDKLERLRESL